MEPLHMLPFTLGAFTYEAYYTGGLLCAAFCSLCGWLTVGTLALMTNHTT